MDELADYTKLNHKRTCVGCGNVKMGSRAKFCNECGVKLPTSLYEPSIDELEDDEWLVKNFGGKCGANGHMLLLVIAEVNDMKKIFCPNCGQEIIDHENGDI